MSVEESQPLISHLVELRNRLLRSFICVLVVFCALVYWANDIYTLLATPLTENLPAGATMIATNVATPFFTPIKLTGVVAVFLSVPFILYQIWAFVAPALYKHEKRLIYPLLVSSTLLFYAGVAFAYYIVFPLVKPTTLFLLVTGIIGSFQVFQNAFLMTGGGPDNSTTMIGLLIYKNAFEYSKFGLACAQAILLAIVIALISMLQFKLMGVDVEY